MKSRQGWCRRVACLAVALSCAAGTVWSAETAGRPGARRQGQRYELDPSSNPAANRACGPVALREALRRLGHDQVSFEDLRLLTGTQLDLTTLLGLARGAERLGVPCKLARLTVEDVERIAANTNLVALMNLTGNKHYMVLDRVTGGLVVLWDGTGSVKVPGGTDRRFLKKDFAARCRGEALVLAKTPEDLAAVDGVVQLSEAEAAKVWGAYECDNGGGANPFSIWLDPFYFGVPGEPFKPGKYTPLTSRTYEPVCLHNGNFYSDATDFNVPGPGQPLRLDRQYNAHIVSDVDGLIPRKGAGQHVLDGGRYIVHGDYHMTSEAWPRVVGATTTVDVDMEALEVNPRIEDWHRPRLLFRAWDDANADFIYWVSDPAGLAVRYGRVTDWAYTNLYETYVTAAQLQAVGKTPFGPHHLKVTYNNTRVQAWVDGLAVMDRSQAVSFPSRQIGLEAWFCVGAFDNLAITDGTYSRTYNFDSGAPQFLFGYGWTCTMDERLVVDASNHVNWVLMSGAKAFFRNLGGGAYQTPSVLRHVLTKTATGWELREKDGLVHVFDSAGRLTACRDRNNNTNAIVWQVVNGRTVPVRMTDGVKRSIAFAYDPNGRVVASVGPMGATNRYEYNVAGDLVRFIDPRGNVKTYAYDAYHHMTQVVDRLGHVMSMTYFYNGRAATQTNPDGDSLEFHYLWEQTEVLNALGELTTYVFDTNTLQLTTVINPLEETRQCSVLPSGEVTGSEDPLERQVTYGVDGKGNVTGVWDQAAGVWVARMQYEPTFNLVTNRHDALGRRTQYARDSRGNLTRLVLPNGGAMTFTYNARGLPLTVTDPLGRVTRCAYNSLGQLIQTIDPAGQVRTYTWDAMGRLTSAADYPARYARITRMSYDALGNMTNLVLPDGARHAFQYDAARQLIRGVDPAGRVEQFAYDWAGNVTNYIDPLGQVQRRYYENADYYLTGKSVPVYETDALNRHAEYLYDHAGRLIAAIDPLARTNSFAYDPAGRMPSMVFPDGAELKYGYDALDRPAVVTNVAGEVVKYDYDLVGNIVKITDAKGGVITCRYDAMNRPTNTVYAGGSQDVRRYDLAGRLTAFVDRGGATNLYAYDAAGRLSAKTMPEGTIRFYYDKANQLIKVADLIGTWLYAYDTRGRVTSVVNPDNKAVRYRYNRAGEVAQLNVAGQSIGYGYDRKGRLTQVADPQLGTFEFAYDAADRLTRVTTPTGLTTDNTYSDGDQLLERTTRNGPEILDRFTYAYDLAGNRVSKRRQAGGSILENESYAYDIENQLLGAQGAAWAQSFTYDPAGNRLTADDSGAITSYQTGGLNQYTNINGYPCYYDKAGRLTSEVVRASTP